MCGICRGGFGAWYCEGGRGRGSGSLDLGGGVLSVTFFLFSLEKKQRKEGIKEQRRNERTENIR